MCLGLRGFDDKLLYNEMRTKMNRANRRDRRDRAASGPMHEAFIHGQDEGNVPSASAKEGMTWMRRMRTYYAGNVIRRDINALDFEDRPLLQLKPYRYEALELQMDEREEAHMNQTVEALQGEGNQSDGEVSAKCGGGFT